VRVPNVSVLLVSLHTLRRLTSPGVASCSGFDNELGDLIVAAGDQVVSPTGKSFEVLKHLGRGTFGQVLKVQSSGNRVYAVKVIRNRPAFLKQAEMEVEMLQRLRVPWTAKEVHSDAAKEHAADPRALVVQMYDHFVYKNHLCLVFEELGVNLLQLLQQNHCRGLSISLIRYFTKQLLKA
jgi:dual specificity protein kinase YAK1